MLKPLTKDHVNAVVRLHSTSLTGLLHDLGPGAISTFYLAAIKCDCAIAYVVQEGGILKGFVFGCTRPRQLKQDILKNSFYKTLTSTVLGVLLRPSTLVSLWRSFRGAGDRGYDTQIAELTYLAVNEEHRTAGLGKLLVDGFGQALIECGVSAYELSVDGDNENAISFYDRLGFVPVGKYREFGINHIRYRLELG